MQTVYVSFTSVMDVKRFVESISSFDGDFDLIDGRFVVDAKSLMGIFSMNLKEPIQLRIQKDSKKAIKAIRRFIVDGPAAGQSVDGPAAGQPAAAQPAAEPHAIMEEV